MPDYILPLSPTLSLTSLRPSLHKTFEISNLRRVNIITQFTIEKLPFEGCDDCSCENMKENYKMRSPWAVLLPAKIAFPVAVLSCSLFFFAGFFASVLFSQEVPSEEMGNVRKLQEHFGVSDWPAMPHGETGEPQTSAIPFQVLSWKPRAFYFPKFASPEKCEAIIKLAKRRLRPSSLALRIGETEESTKESSKGIRTSSGTFLSASQDPSGTLERIEKKIAKVTMIPRGNFEAFNVLRYELNQRYASHFDAFHPDEYGPQKSRRVATFLIYLSDVEEGGETMFPYENGANMDIGYDYKKCIGLKVKPRQGDGILFYSLMTNGTIDLTALHGSCPVIKGVKWAMTKWIRDKEFV